MRFIVADAAATRALGARLGRLLQPGHVVALEGDLGAGKTTLAQGVGAALGVDEVQSPTFVVVAEHAEGRMRLVHVDLYRVEDDDDLAQLDLDGVGEGAIMLIEWSSRFPHALPEDHLVVTLADHGDGRVVTVAATGPVHGRVVEELGRDGDG